MSTCSYCGLEGHNIRTCPIKNDPKTPWLKSEDERVHTKILDDGQRVMCRCQYWDEGEEHYDFDGI